MPECNSGLHENNNKLLCSLTQTSYFFIENVFTDFSIQMHVVRSYLRYELVLFVSLDVTFLNTFRDIILNTAFKTSLYLSNRHTTNNHKYIVSKGIYN